MMKMDKLTRLGKLVAVRQSLSLVLLLGAATVAGFLLDQYVSLTSQAMMYVLAVVIASYRFGWLASVACALAAVTALNFFFVPPRWTFQVERSEHFIALMTMLVVALVINRLATGMRRETELAHRNEQRARQLQTLAIDLSNAHTEAQMRALGQCALDAAFTGNNILALMQPDGELDFDLDFDAALDASVRDGLHCCLKENAILGQGTARWPELDAWYLPLGEKERVCGAVCIESVLPDDDSGREQARAMCAILAQALWRLHLNESVLAAQAEAQRQQLQGIFLAAVSHDLRTPLAVVVGAASALQTQHDKLPPAEQRRLLASIVSEANYLSTLTENTLQLLALANTSQVRIYQWESMEEIVGAVLARVRQRDPGRRILSRVQENLPLVKVDPVLIAQLIANLLDNALKYTDQAIELSVGISAPLPRTSGQPQMLVAVKDRGPGIAEQDRAHIFEAYSNNDHQDRSRQRGAGLGLAVCQAIAQSHGGSLILRRRQGGGSSFCLSLPIDTAQPQALPDRCASKSMTELETETGIAP